MAGSLEMVVSDRENAIAGIRYEWQIQYARFLVYPSLTSSFPDLHRRRNFYKPNLKGTWLSTSSSTASVHLHADRSISDFVLTVRLDGRILEEHFASNLNFTWPQVSCVSGFPSRGSKVVFGSYKDGIGEIQKFALRFSNVHDSEKFVKAIKNASSTVSVCSHDIGSELSCQTEFIQPHPYPYRPVEEPSIRSSIETSNCETTPGLDHEVEQLAYSQQSQPSHGNEEQLPYSLSQDFEGTATGLPPTFMSLLANCYSESYKVQPPVHNEVDFKSQVASCNKVMPTVLDEVDFKPQVAECDKAKLSVHDEVDFKSQIAKYMEDSSFLDMLGKVEKVVHELEDDLMRPSSVVLR